MRGKLCTLISESESESEDEEEDWEFEEETIADNDGKLIRL